MREWGAKGGFIVFLLFVLGAAGCAQGSGREPEASSPAEQQAGDPDRSPADADPEESEYVEVMQDGRSVAQRLEDASVAARARKALVDEAGLRPFSFETEADRGRLTLRGEVATQVQRRRAEEIASKVGGVREVANLVVAAELPEQPSIAEARPEDARPDAEAGRRESQPDIRAGVESTPQDSPSSKTPARAEPEPQSTSGTFHTVASGESLWIISRKYGVTVDDIKGLNDLRTNNLKPGDRLRVK